MTMFYALSPSDPIALELIEEFGELGYVRFLKVLEWCQQNDVWEIDENLVRSITNVNSRSLPKVYPKFTQSLGKVYPKFTQTLPKVYPKFTQSLPKLEASNPCGSIIDTNIPSRDNIINNNISIKDTPKKEKKKTSKKEKKDYERSNELRFPCSPAGNVVKYFHSRLEERGHTKTFLSQKWVDTGVKNANELLKTETEDRITQAIDWFLADKTFWHDKMRYLSKVKDHWDKFESSQLKSSPTTTPVKDVDWVMENWNARA